MYTEQELFDDPNEWKSFHDTCVGALSPDPTAYAEIPKETVQGCFQHLPNHIKNIAHSWGLSDTVFRDSAYEWMQKQVAREVNDEAPST